MRILTPFAILLVATSLSAGVLQPVGASNQLLIPAAGSTPGVNGTFFRSDITILNLTAHTQSTNLQWVAEPGGVSQQVTIDIPAKSGIRSADFVKDYFNTSGIGSILIFALTPPVLGNPLPGLDPTGLLFVSARIWTPQPGTNGTTSQDLPAIPLGTINTPAAAIFAMGGADDPASYRTNVGIVNLDRNNAQTFLILRSAQNTGPITITLPPFTMQQISLGTVAPGEQIQIQNVTPSATRSNTWTAYGSTINNVTGDAWDELAVAGTAP